MVKSKPLQIMFTKEELDKLETIRKKLGLRFKSETIRYLIKKED